MRRVGSTQVGPIVGASSWGNARDVFEDLVHGIRAKPKPAMLRGIMHEPKMRVVYRREVGPVGEAPCTRFEPLLHPTWEFASASPDGFSGDDLVVEFKTASIWDADKWGKAWSDEVPEQYLCQLHWCMAVTGRPRAHLLVAFGTDVYETGDDGKRVLVDFHVVENRPFLVERDFSTEERLRFRVARFWKDHVLTKSPPAMEPKTAIKRQVAAREKESALYERIKRGCNEVFGTQAV